MPQCFQLCRKGETTPQSFSEIDRIMCEHFGVEVHPKYYLADWYNVIGFVIACGKGELGSQELRDFIVGWAPLDSEYSAELLKVLDYLEEHYTSNAWYESSSRR